MGMSFEVKQVGPCLIQVGASIQPIYDQAKETYPEIFSLSKRNVVFIERYGRCTNRKFKCCLV